MKGFDARSCVFPHLESTDPRSRAKSSYYFLLGVISLSLSAPVCSRIHHTRHLGRLEFDALFGTVENHFWIGQALATIETTDLTVR